MLKIRSRLSLKALPEYGQLVRPVGVRVAGVAVQRYQSTKPNPVKTTATTYVTPSQLRKTWSGQVCKYLFN